LDRTRRRSVNKGISMIEFVRFMRKDRPSHLKNSLRTSRVEQAYVLVTLYKIDEVFYHISQWGDTYLKIMYLTSRSKNACNGVSLINCTLNCTIKWLSVEVTARNKSFGRLLTMLFIGLHCSETNVTFVSFCRC